MDQERNTEEIFQSLGYLVVPDFLEIKNLYKYTCELSKRSLIGDAQVPGSPFAYRDPVIEELLIKLLPKVESLIGLELYKTYSYWRMYRIGDILRIHRDRQACEISLTITIGYEGSKPWSIYILDKDEEPVKIDLDSGDALIYRGTERYHWRPINRISRQSQVFLHYVDKKGPYSKWRDDTIKRNQYSRKR